MMTSVVCPICKQKVLTYDGKAKTPLVSKCRKCNVLVTFNPANLGTKAKGVPMRNTSSGCRLW